MRLVILGAPGAGKGTQAVLLHEKLSVPHISTGEIFRYNINNGTELGVIAKSHIDKGRLVPDDVTDLIVADRIRMEDCENGFILDGFPRTIPQAEYLDTTLNQMGINLDAALYIHVDDEDIINRMSGRRTCPSCGMSFHLIHNPPKVEGLCDNCSAALIQRSDDKEETVIERLKNYHIQTEPLLEYYRNQNKLFTVSGKEKVVDTSLEVLKVLGVK